MEAHARGVDHLHLADVLLQLRHGATPIALERELHVLGRHRLTVVELHALPQQELVRQPVGGHGPRLREARRVDAAGHRLDQRVVQGVEHHERGDRGLGVPGIEPARRQRDVQAERDRSFRRAVGGTGKEACRKEKGERDTSLHVMTTSHGDCSTNPAKR